MNKTTVNHDLETKAGKFMCPTALSWWVKKQVLVEKEHQERENLHDTHIILAFASWQITPSLVYACTHAHVRAHTQTHTAPPPEEVPLLLAPFQFILLPSIPLALPSGGAIRVSPCISVTFWPTFWGAALSLSFPHWFMSSLLWLLNYKAQCFVTVYFILSSFKKYWNF